jgi:hypothetical protein
MSSAWDNALILDCSSNRVEGNLIGTDATGTRRIGNQVLGISVLGVRFGTAIGGTNSSSRNIISGGVDGVLVGCCGNMVQGNFVGTAADGVTPMGNNGTGIIVEGSTNLIGGIGAGANVVAFNNTGISVLSGIGNALLGNSVYSNATIGIDLGPAGITPNDTGDFDSGPNNLQNFPILTSAKNTGAATIINGSLNSRSNTSFYIEVFTNSACDPSGYGQGQKFLTSFFTTTDPTGNSVFSFNYPVLLPPGRILTATVTDPDNNTSEFSPCVTVVNDTNFVALSYAASGANLTLSWPIWAASYRLQSVSNLVPPVAWQTISNGITTNGSFKTYLQIISPASPALYFRLSSP